MRRASERRETSGEETERKGDRQSDLYVNNLKN